MQSQNYNRYGGYAGYGNVWHAFDYTLFDLMTDEIIEGQLQKSVDALGGGLTKIYCQVVYEERNKVCTFAT